MITFLVCTLLYLQHMWSHLPDNMEHRRSKPSILGYHLWNLPHWCWFFHMFFYAPGSTGQGSLRPPCVLGGSVGDGQKTSVVHIHILFIWSLIVVIFVIYYCQCYVYIYAYIYMYIYMYVQIYICRCLCLYIHIYIYTHIYMYICRCICICIYIYTYVYVTLIYVYT